MPANAESVAAHKTIYDAAGVAKATAVEYENLLMRLLIADQMPAWTSNRLKRLVHAPKRYLVDAALIPVALRLTAQAVMPTGTFSGGCSIRSWSRSFARKRSQASPSR